MARGFFFFCPRVVESHVLFVRFLSRSPALTASVVCFCPVHVWQQGSAGQLGHSPDDFHPPALQGGLPDHHLQLQELGGLQGREGRQPEESRGPQGQQRPGAQGRGKQPLQIHGAGGHLLSEFLPSNTPHQLSFQFLDVDMRDSGAACLSKQKQVST